MKAPKRALSVFAIGVALALAFFIVPAVTDSGQQASAKAPFTLIYYDGHMHTTRSDGSGSVAQIKATAQARGLSAVIITDHCNMLTLAEWQSLVTETAALSDSTFLALPGYEITGSEGAFLRDHMNAYNAPDPFVGDDSLALCPEEVWPDPPNPAGTGPNTENLEKWVDYVHSQGGIVNHNHTTGDTRLEYGLNNVEIYNQGHVDDLTGYALALGLPPQVAWQLAITINNFAIYGERDLMMPIQFPGVPGTIPLRLALYLATQLLPPPPPSPVGQIVGWSDPPDPSLPGDLNSWDELLMAYVNGTVDTPTFGVANSDAHNTGSTGSKVGVAKNGLYVLALTPRQVYKAIEAGRSFATTGPSLAVDVNGMLMGSTAYVPKGGTANLNLSVKAETPGFILAKIDLIKNGGLPQTIYPIDSTPRSEWDVTLPDTVTARGYYRVEVTSYNPVSKAYQFAYSNPVFVKCPFDKDCDGYLDLIEKLLGSNPDDATSTPESILVPGTCKDGLDNDKDGLIDTADRGCPWAG